MFILIILVFNLLVIDIRFAVLFLQDSIDVSGVEIVSRTTVAIAESLVDFSRHLVHVEFGLAYDTILLVANEPLKQPRCGFGCRRLKFRGLWLRF